MSKDTKNQPATTADPELAQATNDELLALHTAQGDMIADLKAQVEALKAKVKDQPAARSTPATAPVVKIGGKEYRIVHGVSVRAGDGILKTLTPGEISGDTALLKELAAGKSTALQAV